MTAEAHSHPCQFLWCARGHFHVCLRRNRVEILPGGEVSEEPHEGDHVCHEAACGERKARDDGAS
mgnify:CR=1 FL=1